MSSLTRTAHTHSVWKAAAAALFSCLLVLLPGCAIPKLQSADPGPQVPSGFFEGVSPGSSAQLEMHQFFQDPMLTSLVEQALAGNQDLKVLNQDIVIANNEILRRRGAY